MIQPELWVHDTAAAVDYYARAFGAIVEHRAGAPDDPDGVVQPSIAEARFWVAGTRGSFSSSTTREEHGWLVGRIVDPFGQEWEIGRPL